VKIIVLGASGGIGTWVVKLAHQKGLDITAVIRPNSIYKAPNGIQVIEGEVTEPAFVESIIEDGLTIISCIGIRRAGLSPWAKIQSPPNLVETVTSNILSAAQSKQNIRLIWISAAGVGKSRDNCTPIIKKMISLGNIGLSYQDLEKAEELVHESRINAITVRPVTLLPGFPTRSANSTNKYSLFSTIRRSDVADWILRNIDSIDSPPIFLQ
jgi:putative NADH-flavin reductase